MCDLFFEVIIKLCFAMLFSAAIVLLCTGLVFSFKFAFGFGVPGLMVCAFVWITMIVFTIMLVD